MSNTPKQILIQQALGSNDPIVYAHLPIILDEVSGKKMSKRDEASSVKWLFESRVFTGCDCELPHHYR